MKIDFLNGEWSDKLNVAYTHRHSETPSFTQRADCIEGGANKEHQEGFDAIALLTKERFTGAAHASLTCEFEDCGCAEIIIVPETELCPDGATRYGACYEVVVYKDGINVWRHFREGGKCSWHKHLGVLFPVAEMKKHTLDVTVKDGYIDVRVDAMEVSVRACDMFDSFNVGFAVCEGVVRLYEGEIGAADDKRAPDELEKMDEFFERRLDGYDEHMLRDIEGAREFYPFTASLLPMQGGARVLDLGCGTGLELTEYFKLNPSAKVTGIDLSQKMLDALSKKLGAYDVATVCGSYFDLPLGESVYDAAVSVESLHHFKKEDKVSLYKKLHSALRDGGYFILTDYIIDSDEAEEAHMREFARLRGLQGKNDGNLYHYDTPLTAQHECEALLEAGFASVEVIRSFGHTRTIKAIK